MTYPEHGAALTCASIPRIKHPFIGNAIDEVMLMLDARNDANILVLCGPTGVGKTTLGEYLIEAELDHQSGAMQNNPGLIPAIRIEAPASGERDFSWRLFYQSILESLEGDLNVPRASYGVDPETGRVSRSQGPHQNRLSDMRTAVERSLRNRGTRFVVIDEAAHIMMQCRPQDLVKHINTLKSLSNKCGTQWILLGSYDLLETVSLSAQLSRRIHVIHFGRYRQDVPADVLAFRGCLNKLAGYFPNLKEVDLLRYADELQVNTLGCVGTLRSILGRLNLLVGKYGWSEEMLRRALLADAQVTQITREILEGESRIAPGLERHLLRPAAAEKRRVV